MPRLVGCHVIFQMHIYSCSEINKDYTMIQVMDSCFWRKGQEIRDKLPSKLFVYLSTKKGRFIILTPLNKYFNMVPIIFCCLHE